ncbi:phosphoribosylglycinamide formyltransferase [Thioalkalivibrio sp. K90mix]|uniref:phosphoribosylglycinamide formyltransferase n=1 Tax=Thioalkalivibrio sp. (strain K90mix) TaxID=396595 RepID=UPI000195A6CF|nr:phosphoribosylglycinamide formyltransferase [Thioalkalivibrio sp. K90mix]ADC71067.1 phosphoribosylglycinamide formyltransferase [Thioalkalivibrio sp. K90mix]
MSSTTGPANPESLPRLVILISGRGSNLGALIKACNSGHIQARIVGVISNRPDAGGLAYAKQHAIPARVLNHRDYPSREAFDADLAETIEAFDPDLVILAGFMRILTPGFVDRFTGRLLNIHPSLLPKYRGLDTHARALADGEDEHGASVHFVTPELDGGPVIMQARVPVLPDDTPESLATRVQRAEHRLYPEVVRRLCSGEIQWRDRIVTGDDTPLTVPLQLETNEVVPDVEAPEERSPVPRDAD